MKRTLCKTVTAATSILAFVFAVVIQTRAQTVEKLIIYENFGGVDAGSSVAGIQPQKWPAVHSDSGKYCGWFTTDQNLDNKGNNVPVSQFYGNGFFHIDSVQKNRTGGLSGLDISVDDLTKVWSREVPFRNGYLRPITGETTLDLGFFGAAALPELTSWISYAPYTPDYLKNQTDEQGYIYLGKNVGTERPVFTIPGSDIEYLKDISRIELLVSGSRLGQNNTISVRIEELDVDGITLGVDTSTFSATIEPRLVHVPVNKDYCRIYIQTWGSANNANTTDFALMTSNTAVDTRKGYNYNAIAGIKPDGSSTDGLTINPGMSIHMIKIYAFMSGTGYTITTDDGLVTGTKTGIAYGQTVQLTAQATSGANRFMGWNIDGMPDLSEIVNPLNITVTSDMTIMPVYAGDEVEVPVVNENFTNWVQHGITQEEYNNRLDYSNNPPNETVWTGTVRVPLRYGFTSGGEDSVDISLNQCNVIPQYGLRVHNLPGWEKYTGFVAFMGPNDSKGFLKVDSLEGITKAEVDISSYDLPVPDRACALMVNGNLVRNKTLRTLSADNVVIDNDPADPFSLQAGPGNQARCEYLVPASPTADIFTSVSAAAVALHNLKMYAKITLPDLNYYQLTMPSVSGGTISGYSPESGNSTNHYLEGTKVTIMALPDEGFGFEGWVDEAETPVGSENPITIAMDEDKTIKPVFGQKPSYIKLVPNANGEVTTSIEPQSVSNDTLTFLAGISVSLTATPNYGYTFAKWTKNGEDVTDNPIVLSVTDMGKFVTNVITVVYDSITARQTLKIAYTDVGAVSFNHTPESITPISDTLNCVFPAGETIEVKAETVYGYDFSNWKPGLDIPDADTLSNPVTVTMDRDKTIAPLWSPLNRRLLIIETVPNGSLMVTDSHKDGELELQGLWPEDYDVEITIQPNEGWMFYGLNAGVTYTSLGNSVITVSMDQDTVRVIAEFTEFVDVVQITEIFQDPVRWPEPEGNVSNVPGAIEFLGLPSSWDPISFNNDLEGLLEILAFYREWGSQSNDNSDGPSGTKNPMTTLMLNYETVPLVRKIKAGSTPDSVKLTVVKYSACNNCLIAKAVKAENVTNRYLGHVTPGMIALRKPNVESRSVNDFPAFMPGDSLGMMMVEGLAYVDRLEIGYVTSSAQFCPGVFYTTDPVELIDDNGLFGASFGDLWSIGQLSGKEISYRPDQNAYGWGCAQEGMIMDQNMYIAEEGADETKILITAGYKQGDPDYLYSTIYIHDLRIWGSPIHTTGVKDMIMHADDNCRFYMLGNTGILQIEVDEPVRALVIYDMSGQAVKVIREVQNNKVSLAGLRPGVYAVHSYTRSGKMYTGSFGKAY